MNKELSIFPTLKESVESIERLKKQKWPIYSDFNNADEYSNEVLRIIFDEFKILPKLIKTFKSSDFNLPIFRVREVSTFSNINLFTEHSYPPINLTVLNRCNLPNSPVFYGSENPMTAIMEVLRNNDPKTCKFCISKWGVIKSEFDVVFQSFLQTKLHDDNNYKSIPLTEMKQLEEEFGAELGTDRRSGFLELQKFLHSSFINDEDYSLSSILAHLNLQAKHEVPTNVLMYPSIQTNFRGVNFAIHPNFVDNMMRIERLYIVEVEEYNLETGKFKVTFSQIGEIKRNVIHWEGIDKTNPNHRELFKSDFNGLYEIEKEFSE